MPGTKSGKNVVGLPDLGVTAPQYAYSVYDNFSVEKVIINETFIGECHLRPNDSSNIYNMAIYFRNKMKSYKTNGGVEEQVLDTMRDKKSTVEERKICYPIYIVLHEQMVRDNIDSIFSSIDQELNEFKKQ